MSRYAIKIGEIHLRSDKPITETERKNAVRRVLKNPAEALRSSDIVTYVGDTRAVSKDG